MTRPHKPHLNPGTIGGQSLALTTLATDPSRSLANGTQMHGSRAARRFWKQLDHCQVRKHVSSKKIQFKVAPIQKGATMAGQAKTLTDSNTNTNTNTTNMKPEHNTHFTAAMLFNSDKALVQELRNTHELGEKEMMRVILNVVTSNEALLKAEVEAFKAAIEAERLAIKTAREAAKQAEREAAKAAKQAAKAAKQAEREAAKAAKQAAKAAKQAAKVTKETTEPETTEPETTEPVEQPAAE